MKKTYRILTLILAITFSFSAFFVGCSCNNNEISNVESLEFVAFWPPVTPADDILNSTERESIKQRFVDIKDCGFNAVTLVEYNVCGGDTGSTQYTEYMKLCKEVGLKSVIHLKNAGSDTESRAGDGNAYITDYSTGYSLEEILYFDEPTFAAILEIASWIERYKNSNYFKNNIDFTCNLYPYYVDGNELVDSEGNMHDYYEYLMEYCDKVLKNLDCERWLSADIYPYWDTNFKDMETSWLYNLALLNKCAETVENTHTSVYIQTASFGSGTGCREVYEEDIRQQLYVSLAFGVEKFVAFTYGRPVSHEKGCISIVDENCKKTHIYDDMKTVIDEIKNLEDIYLKYEFEGLLTHLADVNVENSYKNQAFDLVSQDEYTKDMILSSLEDFGTLWTTQDTIVSQLTDAKGDKAYVMVNYADPLYKKVDNIILEAKNTSSIKLYGRKTDGSYVREVMVKNDVFEFSLLPGEGCIIIPN